MRDLAELRRRFVYAETEERYQGIALGALDAGDEWEGIARQALPWLHQRLTLLHAAERSSEAEDLHYLIRQIENHD